MSEDDSSTSPDNGEKKRSWLERLGSAFSSEPHTRDELVGILQTAQQDGLIAFTAITSFGMAHKSRLAFISIQAEVDRVREVAQEISELPMINAAMITLGQFNILAMCLFDELDQLVETASDRILDIRGVHHVETSIAVKTIKYNARMAKITAPDELSEETD